MVNVRSLQKKNVAPSVNKKTVMSNFSFQGTRAMFTHPGHLAPAKIKQALRALVPKSCEVKLKILHEVGKSDYEHTHTVMMLSKRVKLGSQKKWGKFRESLGHFDLKPISTDDHFKNALGYSESSLKGKTAETSKVVLDEIGEWEAELPFHIKCINFLQGVKSWSEVLVNPEFSEYISGKLNWAREVYMHARMRSNFEFPSGSAYDWQQTWIDFLKTPADNRTVHWVYDHKGGNGKSDLTNYLLSHNNAFLVDCGKIADIAYAYDNQPIVVFDLARDTEDYCPYRAMEAFKNGRFFSPKYNSCLKTFTPPHVVVFANYMPDMSKLSEDRWDIIRLDNKVMSSEPYRRPAPKKLTGCPLSVKAPPEKKRISPPSRHFDVPPATNAASLQAPTPRRQEEMEAAETSCRNGREDCEESRSLRDQKEGRA